MSLIEKAVEKKKSEKESGQPTAAEAVKQDSPAPIVSEPSPATARPSRPQAPRNGAGAPRDTVDQKSDSAPIPLPAAERFVTIDFDGLQEVGLMSPKRARTSVAEEFRNIKRGLLEKSMSGQGTRTNLIMVTSAAPKEGKTHTAINLALSITKEVDFYVLLVDADLSRPAITKRLGIESANGPHYQGVTDLLESTDLSVGDVILKTNIPNLSIIPSGKPHPLGTELLASQRATSVIDEIANRYRNRIVIFDTSPVLASSEGGALARHVGQIVFVVEAERTKEEMVIEGLEMLDADEKVGVILNKVKTRFLLGGPSGYYGKYYYQYKS